jgi:hypothetical protein
VVEPVDDAVALQLLELLDEHLVAHPPYGSPQFSIPAATVREVEQYQQLPLPTDHGQDGIQAAGEGSRGHLQVFDVNVKGTLFTVQKAHGSS